MKNCDYILKIEKKKCLTLLKQTSKINQFSFLLLTFNRTMVVSWATLSRNIFGRTITSKAAVSKCAGY